MACREYVARIANKDARKYVEELKEFQGSNLFSQWTDPDIYVVYSYGRHYPMYIYDAKYKKWIGNKDKYSRSTTKHHSQVRPNKVDYWLNSYEMTKCVAFGFKELIFDLVRTSY